MSAVWGILSTWTHSLVSAHRDRMPRRRALAGWVAGLARAPPAPTREHADLRARLAASRRGTAGRAGAARPPAAALPRAGGAGAQRPGGARGARAPRAGGAARARARARDAPVHAVEGRRARARSARAVRHARRAAAAGAASPARRCARPPSRSPSALRSGSTRGVWGETQLRRVVEAAGLTRYVDFDTQTSITSDAGAGRPDMVIRLPGDKAIAVDAKVPLDAYLEASAIPLTAQGAEGARRKALLDKHVKAVRAHVDALAQEDLLGGTRLEPRVRRVLRAERVAARGRARRGPVAPGLRVRQARRARLAGQPLGGAQDGRLHVDAAGRLAGGARAVRARQRAVRAARRSSPATPTTCAARSSAPSTATTGSPGRSSRACS